MFFKRNKSSINHESVKKLDMGKIPQHIAIIMDGNGRWAKQRNLPRTIGHRAGVETIKEIVKACSKIGVKYLTLYSFSTENWKRPQDEVSALMNLLVEFLNKELNELHENNVIINYFGEISGLPEICQATLNDSHEKTKNNNGLKLNLALNYGGRAEIKMAITKIAEDVRDGNIKTDEINEELISNYLYTKDMPDPDILIRPSGECRISNFLLYQIAYSELWFADIYWPDFRPEHLYRAIFDFQQRDRRYGGINNKG